MKYVTVLLLQAHTEIKARILLKNIPVPQLMIVIRDSIKEPKDSYLTADKVILCKITTDRIL